MKKQISVTIDVEILNELIEHCKTNSINRSALAQNLIEDYLSFKKMESENAI